MPLTAAEAQAPEQKVQHAKGRPAPTPWQRMLRSSAVWAIIVNNFAFHYAFYVVMNWLPTYFNRCGRALSPRLRLLAGGCTWCLQAVPARCCDTLACLTRAPPRAAAAATRARAVC
jgi:hypothetical protein